MSIEHIDWCDANGCRCGSCPCLGEPYCTEYDYANDLTGKIQYLVNWMNGRGLLEDGIFTFPDGDYWRATK